MSVRKEFTDWIDNFSTKFVRSLHKIEYSKDIADHRNSDVNITKQVTILQNKYKRILQIFEKISNATPYRKLDTI